jgi:Beta-lactamase
MAVRQIVGTSVGVTKNGELLLAKGYGYDLENEVKANEHMIFRIGSVTKQFSIGWRIQASVAESHESASRCNSSAHDAADVILADLDSVQPN